MNTSSILSKAIISASIINGTTLLVDDTKPIRCFSFYKTDNKFIEQAKAEAVSKRLRKQKKNF